MPIIPNVFHISLNVTGLSISGQTYLKITIMDSLRECTVARMGSYVPNLPLGEDADGRKLDICDQNDIIVGYKILLSRVYF